MGFGIIFILFVVWVSGYLLFGKDTRDSINGACFAVLFTIFIIFSTAFTGLLFDLIGNISHAKLELEKTREAYILAISSVDNIHNMDEKYRNYIDNLSKIEGFENISNPDSENYNKNYSYHNFFISNVNNVKSYNSMLNKNRSLCKSIVYGSFIQITSYRFFETDFKYVEITEDGYKLVDYYPN